mmetsp:Transcript_84461/g.196358  ORF Transcript_84461/g.196358 Transcript_84461/m.196358 type:complete len:248 (+) Transcript_84461:1819-2562(+)
MELCVDVVHVLAIDLHKPSAPEFHEEVRACTQRMVVEAEDQLLLSVGAGLAVVAPIHGHQTPWLVLAHKVDKFDGQKAKIILALVATLLEDPFTNLVEAITELFMAPDPFGLVLLLEVLFQLVEDCVPVASADLDVACRAQFDHEVWNRQVHGVWTLENDLLLPDLTNLAHVAAIDNTQGPTLLVAHEIDQLHGDQAHVGCPLAVLVGFETAPLVSAVAERQLRVVAEITALQLLATPRVHQPVMQS